MSLLQLDIPKELNKKLKIYKLEYNLKTIGEATIKILRTYFEED